LATITTTHPTTGVLVINSNSGNITVGGAVAPPHVAGGLSLVSVSGDINVNGAVSTPGYLFLYTNTGKIATSAALASTANSVVLEANKMDLGAGTTIGSPSSVGIDAPSANVDLGNAVDDNVPWCSPRRRADRILPIEL